MAAMGRLERLDELEGDEEEAFVDDAEGAGSEVVGSATEDLRFAVPTNTGDTLTVAAFPVVAAPTGVPTTELSKTSWVGRAVLARSVAVFTPLPW
jgi:hypothetical protein